MCLGGMGILFTAVFTYFGFGLLLWGSLWNASLIEKLGKAKAQWDQLRGGAPPAGQTMTSPIAGASEQNVVSVNSDAEFQKLVGSGARIIVQISASWYAGSYPSCCGAARFITAAAVQAMRLLSTSSVLSYFLNRLPLCCILCLQVHPMQADRACFRGAVCKIHTHTHGHWAQLLEARRR